MDHGSELRGFFADSCHQARSERGRTGNDNVALHPSNLCHPLLGCPVLVITCRLSFQTSVGNSETAIARSELSRSPKRVVSGLKPRVSGFGGLNRASRAWVTCLSLRTETRGRPHVHVAKRCGDWQNHDEIVGVSGAAQDKTPRSRISQPWGSSGADRTLFEIKTETFRFPNCLSDPNSHVSDRYSEPNSKPNGRHEPTAGLVKRFEQTRRTRSIYQSCHGVMAL